MKNTLFFLVVFFNFGFSQTIKGIITDSISGNILKYTNFSFKNSNGGTTSNEEGQFIINIKNKLNDTLKISYLGYKPKFIPLNQFNENKVYTLNSKLEISNNEIDELIISEKRKKYSELFKIKSKIEGDIRIFAFPGCEFALRFFNKRQEVGRIKSVKIHFRKNPNANKLSKYRVKFYTIDSISRFPSEYLLKEDIIINPKNKTYIFELNVEDKKIPFLNEGIFVSVELLDLNREFQKGDKSGPGLRFSKGEGQQLTFENYYGKKWNRSKMTSNLNSKIFKPINILIDLNVLYLKK
ncbi:Probable outer membrane protein precursor [Flavobacterium indicum GPTSA100-9 = DSM 17447]|uniref:Probable outer membrane protein n=1 Tax=Flavobacterium indicum (strain DSM 17447 / CIP 109464 / GPTSA100-9) TaxID=1094466 RepID=H8XQF3_FLAIG|nr:carboxypeptidase-like regulatory domain-containing protein [Flavobacterium indicum]CCG52447.1 Probable outer membrane protein precursor [Flavobacterium indicum GPTSA100-9 = DSM 17447]